MWIIHIIGFALIACGFVLHHISLLRILHQIIMGLPRCAVGLHLFMLIPMRSNPGSALIHFMGRHGFTLVSYGFTSDHDRSALIYCLDPYHVPKTSRTGGLQYSMCTLLEALGMNRMTRGSELQSVVRVALAATLTPEAWKDVQSQMEKQGFRPVCPQLMGTNSFL